MHNIHDIKKNVLKMYLYLKCNVKGVFKIQILKLETNKIKTTHVMCNPWKKKLLSWHP
jgi:hypothetical protein